MHLIYKESILLTLIELIQEGNQNLASRTHVLHLFVEEIGILHM